MNYDEEDPNIMSKEQALERIHAIIHDPKHPYINPDAPLQKHLLAVKYVDRLYEIVGGKTNTVSGYVEEFEAERRENMRGVYGAFYDENKKSAFGGNPFEAPKEETPPAPDGFKRALS